MAITLQFPNKNHQQDYESMVKEFLDNKEKVIPILMGPLKGENYKIFLTRITNYRKGEKLKEGHVPSALYFIIDSNNKVVGGIDMRHHLNEGLKFNAGYAGYGIRPSERKKGYAATALNLALKKYKERGTKNVLMTCDKDNIGSVRVIQKNGGIRDSDYEHEGRTKERYRIKL